MRMIGQLPAEAEARRFCDYLLSRRVAALAEEGQGGQWQIWVEHDDQVDAGRAEFDAFKQSPADARFDAADEAARLRRDAARAAERRQKQFRDVRTTVLAPQRGDVPVTMVIIGIAVAVFVFTHYGSQTPRSAERFLLFDDPNVINVAISSRLAMFDSVLRGQVWRLVTPIFLHGSELHLLFNMLWMLDLGRRIEPVKGAGKFVGIVLTTAVLSNVAQAGWAALSPWDPHHYSAFLGMSGVVAGLFGYAWMCGRYRSYERVGVTQYETGMMLGWLVICSFGVVGPIANAAHWGGLVVGALLGAGPTLWKKIKTKR